MKCLNCGNTNDNPNNKFCTFCGTKLDNDEQNTNHEQTEQNVQNIQSTVNSNQNVINNNLTNNIKNETTTFLVIGIVMALCCSMPFGAGVILLNELKYKKELQNGQLDSAKKTKTIMIVLIVVGILLGIFATGLSFVSGLLEGLSSEY